MSSSVHLPFVLAVFHFVLQNTSRYSILLLQIVYIRYTSIWKNHIYPLLNARFILALSLAKCYINIFLYQRILKLTIIWHGFTLKSNSIGFYITIALNDSSLSIKICESLLNADHSNNNHISIFYTLFLLYTITPLTFTVNSCWFECVSWKWSQ